MIFDRAGSVVASAQHEFTQIFPRPGWVEHDPMEILNSTTTVIAQALREAALSATDLVSVGITNQRETTVVWNRLTGEPFANAIVWQDTRTDELCRRLEAGHGIDRFRAATGLPLATYFSGPKLAWMLEHIEGLASAVEDGEALAGTIDSWLVWNLTGGPRGGRHVTDVTNASRTMLMDLESLSWSDSLLDAFGVPGVVLPEIVASIGRIGVGSGLLEGVPFSAVLGDQQAALFGQGCFEPGDAKNTYGTGCFMLMNTGQEPVPSENGLLTTVAYQVDGQPAHYALEGSVAIAGAHVQWLRDNLGLIDSASEVEDLARSVEDNGDMYFVPAFSGLFAPHWRSDARGAIVGMTRFTNKGHIARATLEATAFQTREVFEAMRSDSGVKLRTLKVDGGMIANEFLMQFQADLLDVEVVRPRVAETTALGAAYGAGLAEGVWGSVDEIRQNWSEERRWVPAMAEADREALFRRWKEAVERTLGWAD